MIIMKCGCNCHTYNHRMFSLCQQCLQKNECFCGFKQQSGDSVC